LHCHKYYHHAREIWFIRQKQMQTNKQKRRQLYFRPFFQGTVRLW
jgi:hypothetical protein